MPECKEEYFFSDSAGFLVGSVIDLSLESIGPHQEKACVDYDGDDCGKEEAEFPAVHEGEDDCKAAGEGGADE